MNVDFVKLTSPKNLLKLALAYEVSEELTRQSLEIKARMTGKRLEDWDASDLLEAWNLLDGVTAAGAAWESAFKPIVKRLKKKIHNTRGEEKE